MVNATGKVEGDPRAYALLPGSQTDYSCLHAKPRPLPFLAARPGHLIRIMMGEAIKPGPQHGQQIQPSNARKPVQELNAIA
jgi:hypothetical protein